MVRKPRRNHKPSRSGVPARAPRLASTEPISAPALTSEQPPITSDITAENAPRFSRTSPMTRRYCMPAWTRPASPSGMKRRRLRRASQLAGRTQIWRDNWKRAQTGGGIKPESIRGRTTSSHSIAYGNQSSLTASIAHCSSLMHAGTLPRSPNDLTSSAKKLLNPRSILAERPRPSCGCKPPGCGILRIS
jgi:hypothetical protein